MNKGDIIKTLDNILDNELMGTLNITDEKKNNIIQIILDDEDLTEEDIKYLILDELREDISNTYLYLKRKDKVCNLDEIEQYELAILEDYL